MCIEKYEFMAKLYNIGLNTDSIQQTNINTTFKNFDSNMFKKSLQNSINIYESNLK